MYGGISPPFDTFKDRTFAYEVKLKLDGSKIRQSDFVINNL